MALRFFFRILMLAAIVATSQDALARKVDIYELSLDENLEIPEIKKERVSEVIQDYQYTQAVELIKRNFEVELMRDNEVMIVTIPAEKLFADNDTTLSERGKTTLKPMLKFLKSPGFYKMLLVMHSDNTGSPAYTLKLTRDRVNAVYDWISSNTNVDFVVPYALGSSDPIESNYSMVLRGKNRRLEIYLVPGEVMIDQAKHGSVNINQIQRK